MKLGIVGGRLQGVEASYLARKAGYEVVLFDRRPDVPALGLADEFHRGDVRSEPNRMRRLFGRCDAVLPACEDLATLIWMAERLPSWGVPLLFDLPAFLITRSKLASDGLFARLDLPRPRYWPNCEFPVIVKPDAESGSHGVRLLWDEPEVSQAVGDSCTTADRVVLQEFIDGPSISVEVIAVGGKARALQVTELEFDEAYDCKRVVAPAAVSSRAKQMIAGFAVAIARELGLSGVMDLEGMLDGQVPKLLEIDARLPSQTPIAVYHSTGLNLVRLLLEALTCGRLPEADRMAERGVVLQHVRVDGGRLRLVGEAALAQARPLKVIPDFYGSVEAITDYRPGRASWVGTLIFEGVDAAAARAAAEEGTAAMAASLGLASACEDVRSLSPHRLEPVA